MADDMLRRCTASDRRSVSCATVPRVSVPSRTALSVRFGCHGWSSGSLLILTPASFTVTGTAIGEAHRPEATEAPTFRLGSITLLRWPPALFFLRCLRRVYSASILVASLSFTNRQWGILLS